MNDKTVFQAMPPQKTGQKKRAYRPPALQTFGQVNMLTQGTGSVNGDAGQGMMVNTSDRACKTNLALVGTHPLGMGLYLFDYKPEFQSSAGFGRKFGVMADEVEVVMPEAVLMHPDGYKQVNYAMLGIDLFPRRVH